MLGLRFCSLLLDDGLSSVVWWLLDDADDDEDDAAISFISRSNWKRGLSLCVGEIRSMVRKKREVKQLPVTGILSNNQANVYKPGDCVNIIYLLSRQKSVGKETEFIVV